MVPGWSCGLFLGLDLRKKHEEEHVWRNIRQLTPNKKGLRALMDRHGLKHMFLVEEHAGAGPVLTWRIPMTDRLGFRAAGQSLYS
eukprot:856172-Pelagomonas_calceolata.AAC.6